MNAPNKLPRRYRLCISFVLIGIVLLSILPASCTCNCSSNNGLGGDWNPSGIGVKSPMILFTSNHEGNYEIYMMSADGSNLTNLTNNAADDRYPIWSPDSTKIAFISDRDDIQEDPGTQFELYVMNYNGSDQRRISTQGARGKPSWSPDGEKIAYEGIGITVVDLDGSGSATLEGDAEMPEWSPDGSKIACLDDNNLVVFDSSELDQRINLTPGIFNYCNEMVWFPDGSKIAYIFSNSLKMINIDGSGSTELANTEHELVGLSMSPDGSRIAYATNNEIWLIDPDGTDNKRLFGPQSYIGNLSWSSDGALIAFSFHHRTSFGRIGPKSGIHTIDIDSYAKDINSEELTQLTDIYSSPVWSP